LNCCDCQSTNKMNALQVSDFSLKTGPRASSAYVTAAQERLRESQSKQEQRIFHELARREKTRQLIPTDGTVREIDIDERLKQQRASARRKEYVIQELSISVNLLSTLFYVFASESERERGREKERAARVLVALAIQVHTVQHILS
jgi:hypothetical protein